jgi:tetratricopeptide (TPR) repeat protein
VAGRRGELRRALDYFERAAELADEPELAVLKVDAAECHLGLGRPEEALIGFEEVFEYLNENVPKVQALAVQAKMAQIHLLIGDPDSSQALAEDVLQKLSPKNEGTYRVLGRILLSRAFARLGRHDLALELAEQAWEGARPWSAKRREGRRIAISNLVDIYSLVGRFDKAEEMIRESGLLGWGLAESELLLRAGHVACAQGRLQAARNYLRLGQSFLTRFRSPALWRSSFLELGAELALQQGDAVRADQLSRQALSLFEQEATGPVDRSRHLVRAARIAGALGDLDRARKLVEEAHALRDLHLGAQHPHTESVEGLTAVFG